MEDNNNMLVFDQPIGQSSYIKVIGVGGGGCNAVNHMCRQGINGVDFIVCNTDIKALNASPVSNKIVLGKLGLGAGNKPERAQRAAEQQADEIREMLVNNTNMLFITAGMGGGTGTGAAPVIAKIAKGIELQDEDTKHILVVAVVTTPFSWEGPGRLRQAEGGIKVLRDTVDSMIVINNDKIRSLGGNMILTEGFVQANNVLFEAVKGISDIITGYGIVNRDFQDVNTVMEGSGRALMGTGTGKGEDRAKAAVVAASSSSLLNDSDIAGAQNMLLYFYFNPEHVITMDEMEEVTSYLRSISRNDDVNIIWGAGYDESLGDELHIILVATGIEAKARETEKPVMIEVKEPVVLDEPRKQDSFQDNVLPGSLEPVSLKEKEVVEAAPEPVSGGHRWNLYEDDPAPAVATAAAAEKVVVEPMEEAVLEMEPVLVNEPVLRTALEQNPVADTKQVVMDLFTAPAAPETKEVFAATPKPEPINSFTMPVSEPVVHQEEPKSADISLVTNRADRVKHLYELLHNHPNGPQMVENLTTEQLSDDVVFQTPPSSQREAPQTKVGANGSVTQVNSYLFNAVD